MAEATKTMSMSVSRETLWKTILDYERYPEFVDGAKNVKIVSRGKGASRVEYGIEMMGKQIVYVLDHHEEKENEVMSWTLVESNFLKSNAGSWRLKDLGGGKTEATYSLELEFKIPVPGFVLSGLVKSSLPRMLSQFENQAKKNK